MPEDAADPSISSPQKTHRRYDDFRLTMQSREHSIDALGAPVWCWFSTTDSIKAEKPSVTAVMETVIAVPVFWWIAIEIGTVLPLLFSAFVAPLMLLRSTTSTALSVRWFAKLELRLHQTNQAFTIHHASIIILCCATSLAASLYATILLGVVSVGSQVITNILIFSITFNTTITVCGMNFLQIYYAYQKWFDRIKDSLSIIGAIVTIEYIFY